MLCNMYHHSSFTYIGYNISNDEVKINPFKKFDYEKRKMYFLTNHQTMSVSGLINEKKKLLRYIFFQFGNDYLAWKV